MVHIHSCGLGCYPKGKFLNKVAGIMRFEHDSLFLASLLLQSVKNLLQLL